MAILGAIIGAGFASGREIASFFGNYGIWVIPFIFVASILFFFCFYLFAKLGKDLKPKSISDITSSLFGKAGVFVDFAFVLSTFITLASMLAGSDSIGSIMFGAGYNFCYISIFTAVVVAVIVSVGLKYIYKITDIILPVMLVVLTIILIIFFAKTPAQTISSENAQFNGFSVIIYTLLYVAMNTFYNIFIISRTSQLMNKKQLKWASGISAGILLFLLISILLAIFHGGDAVLKSDMPLLAIANVLGGEFGIIYSIVLYFAIFTTICLNAYAIVEWLNRFIKNKFVCSVVVLTLGFIFSRFGFSTIVDIFYPIEGIFGLFFIIYTTIYFLKKQHQKKLVISDQNAIVKPDKIELKNITTTNNQSSEEIVSLKVEKFDNNITVTKKYKNGKIVKTKK